MIDKETLFKSRTGEQEIEIDGVGSVRIRALTRAEVLSIKGREFDAADLERKLLAMAMLEPKLTEDEVKQWQEASTAGELQEVADAVIKLSGMEKIAAKEAYRQFRG